MQPSNPLITVVIPTFRRPRTLKQAIESVLNQTYPHLQVCVFDDASGDETEKIVLDLAERDNRVKYHLHPKNIGSNANWQFAFNAVDTPFFCVLADDDLFMPTFLEEAMKGFEQYPDAGTFMGGLIFIDEKKRVKHFDLHTWTNKPLYTSKEYVKEIAADRPLHCWASTVFRKEARDATGELNTDVLWIDLDYLIRIYTEFSVIISHKPCSVFRIHTNNISLGITMREVEEMSLSLLPIVKKIFDEMELVSVKKSLHHKTAQTVMEHAIQRCAQMRFEECLQGIEILKKYRSLNLKIRLRAFLSVCCLKSKLLTWVFSVFIRFRRIVRYYIVKVRLKKELSIEEFNRFITLKDC